MTSIFSRSIKASRPISWINTAFPFAATYIFISKEVDPLLFVGALYFLIPFNLLMYGINDVFDYESDKNNPRKDSMEGAVLDKSVHKKIIIAVLLTNIPFLVILALLTNFATFVCLLFVVFTAVAYSAPPMRFKEVPILDSLTSATHFVGPMLVALVSLGELSSALVIVLAFFLWGMASHSFGAIQDIIPDRKGNIDSIATKLGAKNTLLFSLVAYSLCALLLMFYSPKTFPTGVVGLIYSLNVASFIGVDDKNSAKTNKGWKRFIWLNWFAGFVITITLILCY